MCIYNFSLIGSNSSTNRLKSEEILYLYANYKISRVYFDCALVKVDFFSLSLKNIAHTHPESLLKLSHLGF